MQRPKLFENAACEPPHTAAVRREVERVDRDAHYFTKFGAKNNPSKETVLNIAWVIIDAYAFRVA